MDERHPGTLGDVHEDRPGLPRGARHPAERQQSGDSAEPDRRRPQDQKLRGSNPGGLTMLALDPTTRISSKPRRTAITGADSVAVR